MRTKRYVELMVIGLAALTLGSSCPLIPKVEDRVVELAVGGSTTAEFVAAGIINTYDDTQTVDIHDGVNLSQILSDGGIDVSDVKSVALSGVSYRVTVPDPNPGRTIANGNVTIQRAGGSEVPLVTNLNQNVDAATSFTTATLDPQGVAVLNGILQDLLTEVQTGTPAANTTVTYHVLGDSQPTGASSSFTWQLKVDINIVGTIKVKVVG
jgi:hypothetical protein